MQLLWAVELDWVRSWREAIVGLGALVVVLALVHCTVASSVLLVLTTVLLGVPVGAFFWDPGVRKARGRSREAQVDRGEGRRAQTQAPVEDAGPAKPAQEEQPPPERTRIVCVYGVKLKVAEDGLGRVSLDTPCEGESIFPAPPDDEATSSTEAPPTELLEHDDGFLPPSLVMSLVRADQCLDKVTGRPLLRVTFFDGELNLEEMENLLIYTDRFTLQREAMQLGFATLYDLRSATIPPVTLLQRMNEFCAEPARLARWRRLNYSNKIVVSEGPGYFLRKGVFSAYMLVRPPVVRTWLLTDPDQDEDEGTCWEACEDPLSQSASPDDSPSEGGSEGSTSPRRAKETSSSSVAAELPEVRQELDRYLAFIAMQSK